MAAGEMNRKPGPKGITLGSPVISLSSTVLRPPYHKIPQKYIDIHSAYLGKSPGALIINHIFGDSCLMGSTGNPSSLSIGDLAVTLSACTAVLLFGFTSFWIPSLFFHFSTESSHDCHTWESFDIVVIVESLVKKLNN